jgi:hypothetical protein
LEDKRRHDATDIDAILQLQAKELTIEQLEVLFKYRRDQDLQRYRAGFVVDNTSDEYKRGDADGRRCSLDGGDCFAPPTGGREDHCNYVAGYNAGRVDESMKKIGRF